MKREWPLNVPCTEPGCAEVAHYRYDTKRDLVQSFELKHRATYKCVRHSKGAGVLTSQNLRAEWISAPSDERPYGRFWGSHGVLIGHGYYASAKNFPPGTRVKITAEVLPPDTSSVSQP